MQETRNSCFGLKKCSTILHQKKTNRHESRTSLLFCGTRTCPFLFYEGLCYFSTRNNCREFLYLMALISKVFFSQYQWQVPWCFLLHHLSRSVEYKGRGGPVDRTLSCGLAGPGSKLVWQNIAMHANGTWSMQNPSWVQCPSSSYPNYTWEYQSGGGGHSLHCGSKL